MHLLIFIFFGIYWSTIQSQHHSPIINDFQPLTRFVDSSYNLPASYSSASSYNNEFYRNHYKTEIEKFKESDFHRIMDDNFSARKKRQPKSSSLDTNDFSRVYCTYLRNLEIYDELPRFCSLKHAFKFFQTYFQNDFSDFLLKMTENKSIDRVEYFKVKLRKNFIHDLLRFIKSVSNPCDGSNCVKNNFSDEIKLDCDDMFFFKRYSKYHNETGVFEAKIGIRIKEDGIEKIMNFDRRQGEFTLNDLETIKNACHETWKNSTIMKIALSTPFKRIFSDIEIPVMTCGSADNINNSINCTETKILNQPHDLNLWDKMQDYSSNGSEQANNSTIGSEKTLLVDSKEIYRGSGATNYTFSDIKDSPDRNLDPKQNLYVQGQHAQPNKSLKSGYESEGLTNGNTRYVPISSNEFQTHHIKKKQHHLSDTILNQFSDNFLQQKDLKFPVLETTSEHSQKLDEISYDNYDDSNISSARSYVYRFQDDVSVTKTFAGLMGMLLTLYLFAFFL